MTELTVSGPAVIHAEIACGRIADAATALNAICDRVEDMHGGATIALNISNGPVAAGVDVHLLTQWERALRRLERSRSLSVVTARSDCHSFALDLLLVADYRIIGESVQLRMRESSDDILPTMAIHRLAAQIGAGRARRAVLLNDPFAPHEALALGLVDEIASDPDDALTRFVARFRDLDTSSLAVRRQLLLEAQSRTYEDALGTHLAACDRLLRRMQGS